MSDFTGQLDVEALERVDAVCDRFEDDWRAGQRPQPEEIVQSTPEPLRSALLAALLQVELELRRKDGTQPTVGHYRKRFPNDVELIERVFSQPAGSIQRSRRPFRNTVSVSASAVDTSQGGATFRCGRGNLNKIAQFEILETLGSGAMGTVYLANDTEMLRRVALKVPHFSADSGPDVAARFRREGQALAALRHRCICPVYEAGQDDGVLYLAMAYVEGRAFSDVLATGSPMDARSAAKLAGKLALALSNAHEAGVVHRDLKPANVMIDRDGQPAIMDFGLAKLMASEDGPALSQPGMVLGTPAYMSPEQAGGETRVGPSADIYSLGVMFFEMLTSRLPFETEGRPLGILLGVILTQPPERPTKYVPDLDPDLEAICLKALEKSASDRYATRTK